MKRGIGDEQTARSSNCFDFLRLFAAVAVVFGHSTHHLGVSFLWFAPDSRLWFRDGVTLFFILSGFLVFRSAQRCIDTGRPLWQFYSNRFLRVGPAIYAYLLVVTPLLFVSGVVALGEVHSVHFLAWCASTAVLVPVYHPDAWRDAGTGNVNGSLWTIPVECSFYVVVPFLALAAKRFGFARMMSMLATVSLVGLFMAFLFDVPRSESMPAKFLGITFLPYLAYFGVGIFWTRAWNRVPQSGALALASLAGYAIVRGFLSAPNERGGIAAFAGVLLWIMPFSYAAMWVAHHGPRVLSRFTERVGDLSYGVYIWHIPVINAVIIIGLDRHVRTALNPMIHLFVLAATIVLAEASWKLVEKPSLRLKPFTSRPHQDREISTSMGTQVTPALPLRHATTR